MRVSSQSGFSLLETLVAMTVLAVSSTAILSVTETHARTVAAVTDRTVARWIAENAMLTVELGHRQESLVAMASAEWRVRVDRSETGDPDLDRVDISVARASAPEVALARLTGFVDARAGKRQ